MTQHNIDALDALMFDAPHATSTYSMDNIALYGSVVSNHPYPEMVKRNRVSPTQLIIVQASTELWDSLDVEHMQLQTDNTSDVMLTSDGQIALAVASISARKWLDQEITAGNVPKALAFYGRIVDCERGVDPSHPLSLVYKLPHNIDTYTYHSDLTTNQRRQTRAQFANRKGPAVLASVRAIREGVSINDANTGILLRGYGTQEEGISADLQQHHGRIVRKDPNNPSKIAKLVVVVPPVGRATEIRQTILRMVRDLMEELGMLTNLMQVLENGNSITAGILADNDIIVYPPTLIDSKQIADDIQFEVLDYAKRYCPDAHDAITTIQFFAEVDDIANI